MTETVPAAPATSHWRRYRILYLLLAVCVAPVIASYTAYYLLPPSGRTNYGALIEPQRPLRRSNCGGSTAPRWRRRACADRG